MVRNSSNYNFISTDKPMLGTGDTNIEKCDFQVILIIY